MTTTVQNVIDELAERVQENHSTYGGTDWSTGLWSVTEIIAYINAGCKQFILDSQAMKIVSSIESVADQRIYDDPENTMQLDRITFNNKPLYRTTRTMLDRENPSWRRLSGIPRQYHQDQLSTKKFEVDRAPTAAMTGTGYTVTGSYGTLRQMSGAYTYVATIPAGGGSGLLRTAQGVVSRIMTLSDFPGIGTLRSMLAGATNFEVIGTRRMPDVSVPEDELWIQDFMVPYVRYWVLKQMLSKEGEGQDISRAKYCQARYDFGIKLFRRLLSCMNDQVAQT